MPQTDSSKLFQQGTPEHAPKSLARLIDSLGSAQFGDALLQFLHTQAHFDSALILLYHPRRRPAVVVEALAHPLRRNSAEAYLSGAYLLDPFRARARMLKQPSVLRLADIAPSDFLASEYFQSYYKDSNLVDEVNYLVPVAPQQVFAVSVGRSRSMLPFEDTEIARFKDWLDVVSALFKRHASSYVAEADDTEDAGADREHDRLEALLADFGSEILTPREHQIAQLLLRGMSTPLIAIELAVSAQTVRVHRRNIYDKLDVSSLGQLFSLAMQGLLGDNIALR